MRCCRLAMADLLVDGASNTVDLTAFTPARFMVRMPCCHRRWHERPSPALGRRNSSAGGIFCVRCHGGPFARARSERRGLVRAVATRGPQLSESNGDACNARSARLVGCKWRLCCARSLLRLGSLEARWSSTEVVGARGRGAGGDDCRTDDAPNGTTVRTARQIKGSSNHGSRWGRRKRRMTAAATVARTAAQAYGPGSTRPKQGRARWVGRARQGVASRTQWTAAGPAQRAGRNPSGAAVQSGCRRLRRTCRAVCSALCREGGSTARAVARSARTPATG